MLKNLEDTINMYQHIGIYYMYYNIVQYIYIIINNCILYRIHCIYIYIYMLA